MKKLIIGLCIIIAACAGITPSFFGGLPVLFGVGFVFFGVISVMKKYNL